MATKTYNVLSYNVCWECMTVSSGGSAGTYGATCGTTVNNHCRQNIINICNRGNYDFIGIQEGGPGLAAAIPNLQTLVYTAGRTNAILLYNAQTFTPIGNYTAGNVPKARPGRPYIAQRFKDNATNQEIIVMSLHADHKDILEANLQSMLFPIMPQNYLGHLIIMGDFNREWDNNITLTINGNQIKMNVLNKDHNTCCHNDPKTHPTYHRKYDNIMISANIQVEYGYPEYLDTSTGNGLLPQTSRDLLNKTSDHIPIAAKLSVQLPAHQAPVRPFQQAPPQRGPAPVINPVYPSQRGPVPVINPVYPPQQQIPQLPVNPPQQRYVPTLPVNPPQQRYVPTLPVNPPRQGPVPVIDPVYPQQNYYKIQNQQHLQYHIQNNLHLFTYNTRTNQWNKVSYNPYGYLQNDNLYSYGNVYQQKYLKYKMKYLRLKGVNMNFVDK
jgi:hypothetical protein